MCCNMIIGQKSCFKRFKHGYIQPRSNQVLLGMHAKILIITHNSNMGILV